MLTCESEGDEVVVAIIKGGASSQSLPPRRDCLNTRRGKVPSITYMWVYVRPSRLPKEITSAYSANC